MRRLIQTVCILLLVGLGTTGQMCDDPEQKVLYPRVFFGIRSGPRIMAADRTTARSILGDCNTPQGLVGDMIEHYRAYGVDLSAMRRDPYSTYENADVTVLSRVTHNDAVDKIVSSTFYEYAKYLNVDFKIWGFILQAKRDLRGPGGDIVLPANNASIYGLFRFRDDGHDLCVKHYTTAPIVGPLFNKPVGSSSAMQMRVENNIWGTGLLSSIATKLANGTYDTFVMTFPDTLRL